MNSTVLEVRSIDKQFERVTAVSDLSFDVKRGEIFALLGPNGAGKTTVVRMLLNILHPDAGTIHFHLNGETSRHARRADIGYLPEDRGLYREIAIDRTLTYMGVLRGMTRPMAAQAADRWLETLGLLERKAERLEQLSKGNQQKVQFIAAVLHQPKVAILDEPFSGLDPVNQELFLEIIAKLRDSGVTILLSAHQMDLVQRLADRVLLMNRGRMILEGTIDQILNRSAASKIVILRIDGQPIADVIHGFEEIDRVEALNEGEFAFSLKRGISISDFLLQASTNLKITDIRSKDPTLHEVFLHTIGSETGLSAERAVI